MPRSKKGAKEETPLQTYLREINRFPLLSAEEEKRLAKKVAKRDRAARDAMVRANLRLVVSIAKNYRDQGLPLADLIEEGNLGLLRAVEGFDPSEGCKFSTYATWWIRQAIRRALVKTSKTIRLPAHMVATIAQWKSVAAQLADGLGREPTVDEIADAMDISPAHLSAVKRAISASMTSGDSAGPEGTFETVWPLSDRIEDKNAKKPDEEVFDADEKEKLRQLLDIINRREAAILRMRFGLDDDRPMTLREVGKELGISRERVRQIEDRALTKLGKIMDPGAS